MIAVCVQHNDLGRAIQVFKSRMRRDGILEELKRRQGFATRTERRKLKSARAERRKRKHRIVRGKRVR